MVSGLLPWKSIPSDPTEISLRMRLEWKASCVLESVARRCEGTAVNKGEARGKGLERATIAHGAALRQGPGDMPASWGGCCFRANWIARIDLDHGLGVGSVIAVQERETHSTRY